MPTITPFLWFDTEAEDAMNFYASIFAQSKVGAVSRAAGKVVSVRFERGWLEDRFEVSWQVVPNALGGLMGGGDPARSGRVMDALLRMNELDLHQLQQAYDDA